MRKKELIVLKKILTKWFLRYLKTSYSVILAIYRTKFLSAFILESTIAEFPQGSVYEKHTAYLTDDNTTTCIQIQPTNSRLNLFELKLFSSVMCSDVLKVDVTFTNLSCNANHVVVYSPTIVNGGSACAFTEHLKQSKCNVSEFTETQYVRSYKISDDESSTCDFLYIFLPKIPSEYVQICEITFYVN